MKFTNNFSHSTNDIVVSIKRNFQIFILYFKVAAETLCLRLSVRVTRQMFHIARVMANTNCACVNLVSEDRGRCDVTSDSQVSGSDTRKNLLTAKVRVRFEFLIEKMTLGQLRLRVSLHEDWVSVSPPPKKKHENALQLT